MPSFKLEVPISQQDRNRTQNGYSYVFEVQFIKGNVKIVVRAYRKWEIQYGVLKLRNIYLNS